MITIEREPMKGPPSWRCQIGAGNLARSTSLPLTVCCKKAASLTTAGARGCSALRFSIQALSASSGRNVGSMPSASAARCGLGVALVKMRKPRGKPLMGSDRSAGPSGRPAATSVTAPISKRGSAPSMRRSAPSLSTSSMNSRKSLYISFAPAAADALRIAACAPCGQARFLAILRHPDGSRRTKVMAKLRHIALIVPDPEKAAKFFEDAFDMKVAGKARRGLYVSDGTVNVALLKQEGNEKVGIYHFGMWVDDLDEAEKKVVGAGGKYLAGRPEPATPGATAHSYYEAKYKDPLGIVFDLTHTGWVGAVKDVVAAKN